MPSLFNNEIDFDKKLFEQNEVVKIKILTICSFTGFGF